MSVSCRCDSLGPSCPGHHLHQNVLAGPCLALSKHNLEGPFYPLKGNSECNSRGSPKAPRELTELRGGGWTCDSQLYSFPSFHGQYLSPTFPLHYPHAILCLCLWFEGHTGPFHNQGIVSVTSRSDSVNLFLVALT